MIFQIAFIIIYCLYENFGPRKFLKRKCGPLLKKVGRPWPTPNLQISQSPKSREKQYTRRFNASVYQRCEWICDCEHSNALFCFPYLLFKYDNGDTAWTKTGQTDLKKLPENVRKHAASKKHINCIIDLSHLGQAKIAVALNTGHQLSIARHNEAVRKNRKDLSKIIDCIKFCREFELPLRGNNERVGSTNPGVFRSLLDLTSNLDSVLNHILRQQHFLKVHQKQYKMKS